MFPRIFLILVTSHYVLSNSMDVTKTAVVTSGGITKTATCDISVTWSGGQVDTGASSISCSINWPKKKALNKAVSVWVLVGDVTDQLINVEVKFTLKKAKNKDASTTQTKNPNFSAQDYAFEDPPSYPADLWCPQEDKIIWSASNSIVNETVVTNWQDCAQLCSSYTNEAGNAPCFSWTFNNAGSDVLGLPAGACRLLPYETVFRMDAAGVQSGYHKCWFAWSTSVKP